MPAAAKAITDRLRPALELLGMADEYGAGLWTVYQEQQDASQRLMLAEIAVQLKRIADALERRAV